MYGGGLNYMSKVDVTIAAISFSYPARHARHAASSDSVARAGSRLRDRATARANIARDRAGEPRLFVSGAAPARAKRLAESGMEGIGNRPRGQVLFAYASGRKAACARKGELEPADGRRPVDF